VSGRTDFPQSGRVPIPGWRCAAMGRAPERYDRDTLQVNELALDCDLARFSLAEAGKLVLTATALLRSVAE